MPNRMSINYLFPPDRINDLPRWRFVLHFQAPRLFSGRALRKAIALLAPLDWKAIQFECPVEALAIHPGTNTLDIPIEVPESRRRQPNSLADYESDVWKIYGHVAEAGFGDLFYEAVDWQEEQSAANPGS